MIATEDVAKTKVCPIMSHRMKVEGYVEPLLLTSKCLASGCMAWKWASGFSPEELQARSNYNQNPSVPKGYCGA